MKRKRTVAALLAVLALTLIGAGGYKIWESRRVYRVGDAAYEMLRSQSFSESSSRAPAAELADGAEAEAPGQLLLVRQAEIPAHAPDYAALHSVNPDIIGWLYCPDTVVDYPVVGAYDYDYYAERLPDGSRNGNGTLFLDYNVAWDFSDRFNIIYGHSMVSGAMFGHLSDYKEQEYFDAHPYWYLYTPDGNYRVDLMYGYIIAEEDWKGGELIERKQQDSMLAYAAENTTFHSPVQPSLEEDERYIAFSTCTYEFTDARYVVAGRLTPEFTVQRQSP